MLMLLNSCYVTWIICKKSEENSLDIFIHAYRLSGVENHLQCKLCARADSWLMQCSYKECPSTNPLVCRTVRIEVFLGEDTCRVCCEIPLEVCGNQTLRRRCYWSESLSWFWAVPQMPHSPWETPGWQRQELPSPDTTWPPSAGWWGWCIAFSLSWHPCPSRVWGASSEARIWSGSQSGCKRKQLDINRKFLWRGTTSCESRNAQTSCRTSVFGWPSNLYSCQNNHKGQYVKQDQVIIDRVLNVLKC